MLPEFPSYSKGNPLFTGLAAAIGIGLSMPVVFPLTRYTDLDRDSSIAVLLLIGVGIGGLGTIFRALAHRQDDSRHHRMDHSGKLLAVVAFVFAAFAGVWKIAQLLLGTVVAVIGWASTAISILAALVAIVVAVINARNAAKAGKAASVAESEAAAAAAAAAPEARTEPVSQNPPDQHTGADDETEDPQPK